MDREIDGSVYRFIARSLDCWIGRSVDLWIGGFADRWIGSHRDRGGGGAGRAIALPLFCWDLSSRAPVDMENVIVELLDFSLKGGRLEPVVFDESLRTMQFLWKSGMLACPNDYNPMCVQG